jgi:5'-nucleotidase / UDP-sugar diphosphatase
VNATRTLERIIATTDVHSSLDRITPLLAHLHDARKTSLVADCGDFFEGTGYYRLGEGSIEREILLSLYDVLAPGNHGWRHHFEPGLHEITVCANAIDSTTRRPLFRRWHRAEIHGRQVAVTAVIGLQAFAAISLDQRIGQEVTDPSRTLLELFLEHHHEVDAWVLLSHTGFAEDLRLAANCPFLDVVFSGHCHSARYGPHHVGDTLVLKGPELGLGYAMTEPVGTGWGVQTRAFPVDATVPPDLKGICDQIDLRSDQLAAPLGTVQDHWRGKQLDRTGLLTAVASQLHTGLGMPAVVLNETALREAGLGKTLHLADLLAVEPFDNQLVHAFLPEGESADLPALLAQLRLRAGTLITSPDPLPPSTRSILTTGYLAETIAGTQVYPAGLRLGQAVRHVLVQPPEYGEGDPH